MDALFRSCQRSLPITRSTKLAGGRLTVFELGHAPLLLTDSILGRGWQGAGGNLESTMPPAATLDEETGEIVIQPNLVRTSDGEATPLPEIRLAPGRRASLGQASIIAAPVVRAGVEVQNAFGNVARDEVEIVLTNIQPTRRRAAAGQGGPTRPRARLQALREAAAARARAQGDAANNAPAVQGTP